DRLELLALCANLSRRLRPDGRGGEVIRNRQAEANLALLPRMPLRRVEHELAEEPPAVDERDEGKRCDAFAFDGLAQLRLEAGGGELLHEHRLGIDGVLRP